MSLAFNTILITLYIHGTTLICINISQPVLVNLSSTLYAYSTQHLWLPDDGCDLQAKHTGASNPTVQSVGNKLGFSRK